MFQQENKLRGHSRNQRITDRSCLTKSFTTDFIFKCAIASRSASDRKPRGVASTRTPRVGVRCKRSGGGDREKDRSFLAQNTSKHKKVCMPSGEDTDAATATKLDPTTLLHNQHRATRQHPRRRERNPCLHLPARSPQRENIKVWMITQTRGETARCRTTRSRLACSGLRLQIGLGIAIIRNGVRDSGPFSHRLCQVLRKPRDEHSKPATQESICVHDLVCATHRYNHTSPCPFVHSESMRRNAGELARRAPEEKCLLAVIPRNGRPTRRKKQHFRGND